MVGSTNHNQLLISCEFFVASCLSCQTPTTAANTDTFRLPYDDSFWYFNYCSLPINCFKRAITFSSSCVSYFKTGNVHNVPSHIDTSTKKTIRTTLLPVLIVIGCSVLCFNILMNEDVV